LDSGGNRHALYWYSVQRFKAGDLVLVGGNVPHTWASGSEQKGDAQWTVLHFNFEHWGSGFEACPKRGGSESCSGMSAAARSSLAQGCGKSAAI
jgi:hypothetical protein